MREALDALIQLAAYRHSTRGDQKSALDEIFTLPDERRSRWRRTGIRTLGPSSSKAGPRPRHDSAAAPSGGRPSCGRGCGGGGECLGAAGPEVGGGVVVSPAGENVGELVMSGKEALNVPRRLEPLHDPLSSSGRLVGVFCPVFGALCRLLRA